MDTDPMRDQHADPRWWDNTPEAYDLKYTHGTAIVGMQSIHRAAAEGDSSARSWICETAIGDRGKAAELWGVTAGDIDHFIKTLDYVALVDAIASGTDAMFWLGDRA